MVQNMLEKTKNLHRRKKCAETEEGTDKDKEMHLNHVNSLLRRKRYKDVRKLVKEEDFQPWTRDMQAKVFYILHFLLFFLQFDCDHF